MKELIIELLDKADDSEIKVIYAFIKAFIKPEGKKPLNNSGN